MLDNNEFFNQLIMTSENIQERLSQFTRGLDMETIVELINTDIQENHLEEETFKGEIRIDSLVINYIRDFVQYNAIFVCDEWAKKKKSVIKIKHGNTTVVIAGDDYRLEVRKSDSKNDMTLKITLDSKTGMMNIEQKGNLVEPLDSVNLEILKEHNKKK